MANFSGSVDLSELHQATKPKQYRRDAPPRITQGGPGRWGGPGAEVDTNFRYGLGGQQLGLNVDNLSLREYRAMRSHYQISATLKIITATAHEIDWRVTGGSTAANTFIEENLRDVWTELIIGMSQAFWAGYSPLALQFENDVPDRKVRLKRIKDLIPEYCDVHWKKVAGTRNRTEPCVPNPGRKDSWIYDGIKQDGEQGHIRPESTLWYPLLMENGNMKGQKLLKAAYEPWFFSQLVHLWNNRYFENFATPVVVARAPFDDSLELADGSLVTGQEVMVNVVNQLRNNSSVVLPSQRTPGVTGNGDKHDFEYLVDFLESSQRGADFDRLLTRYDEEMSLALFTPVLLFRTADVGSYNLGQAHERVFYQSMNMLVEDMMRYINRFLIPRMVGYNFTQEMARSMRLEHRKLGRDTDETVRAMAQALLNGGLATPNLAQFGEAMNMEWEAVTQIDESLGGPTSTGSPAPSAPSSAAQLALQVGDRLRGQFRNAHANGRLDEVEVHLSHERQAVDLLAASMSREDAEAKVEKAYRTVHHAVENALDVAAPDAVADLAVSMLTLELSRG